MLDWENIDMDVDFEFEVVVVIDFGIIYLGYVYLMIDDYKKDKFNIFLVMWKFVIMIFFKIFMFVLLDFDKVLVVFGYDVEFEYIFLVEKNEYEDFYYFRWFKMEFFNEIRDFVSIVFLCIIYNKIFL